jgi:hypothetical protein
MPTITASATLQSTFSVTPITGFVSYQEGILDSVTGTIKPQSNSLWSALTGKTWTSWSSYTLVGKTIKWTAPEIDLGEIKYFTLNVDCDFDGSLFLRVYVSNTGDWVGEQTEYYIANGNYSVDAFYGRYVYVTAVVDGAELRKFEITTNSNSNTYELLNVDTSTLSGTASSRTIALSRTVSRIIDIQIQPKAATSYAVDLYVSNSATSEVLIPVVKSKTSSAPTFALYGIDNVARDGVVDILITALPRMVMYGGKLTVVS